MILVSATVWPPWYPESNGLGCYHTGLYTEHEDGSSMPCITSQCNHCSCMNGRIASTRMGCHDDSCFKDGIEYKHGSIVPKGDGCSDCDCFNGKIRCVALIGCPESVVISIVYFSL